MLLQSLLRLACTLVLKMAKELYAGLIREMVRRKAVGPSNSVSERVDLEKIISIRSVIQFHFNSLYWDKARVLPEYV